MRLRAALRLLAAGWLASGCAPDPPCGLRICDIRDADCQSMAAAAAACLRGVDPVAVPVAVVSRADFVAQAAATSLTPDEESTFQRWNAGLAALGMAPADNTPSMNSAAGAGQIAGQYSATAKQITIVDDGVPLDDFPSIGLLVHENVHAIQDARFDLGQLSASHPANLDSALAVGSVVEGEASYVEDVTDAGFFGTGAADIPWQRMLDQWQAWAKDQARMSPLPVTLSWLHFRYPFGTGLVRGAVAASDWAGVDGLFAAPPSGAREVMAGFGATEPGGGAWVEDLGEDAVPDLGDEYDYIGADRMGAWLFEVFLSRLDDPSDAKAQPALLRGDTLSIFQDRITGGAVAFWRLRFSASWSPENLQPALNRLPAARVQFWANDIILEAATDQGTLALLPIAPLYRAVPPSPAPSAGPMAGRARWGCARPVR